MSITWQGNNRLLLSIPELTNVNTSATGVDTITTLQTQVDSILAMVDTTNRQIRTNSISRFNTTPIQFIDSVNFQSNVSGSSVSNISSLNTSFYVNGGNIYVSSATSVVGCGSGNIFCDGQVYATGLPCPSDQTLKKDIVEFESVDRLPTPVRFKWIKTEKEDVGFIAQEMKEIFPECVSVHPKGYQTIDYAKLTVICIDEIRKLKMKVTMLEDEVRSLKES
jgi:hypothetical protein